jgi:hypothetical protein
LSEAAVSRDIFRYLVGGSELLSYTSIMADQAQAAANAVKEAVNNVTEKVGELTTGDNAAAPTLYVDEVTGEKVSKTERECETMP